MAFTALDRLVRVALLVPVRVGPVVVLVLELHPADAVDLLIDELLVARGTILGFLERALGQFAVLGGIAADKEIARHSGQPVRLPLPEILVRLRDGVIGVALDVGLADGVAGETQRRSGFRFCTVPLPCVEESPTNTARP